METIVSRPPSAASRLTAHLYRHRWLYLLAALLFALCILPLVLVPMPKGHDILFHLNRIEALSAEIKAGNIPARIYHTVYGGVGYASGMFYGDWLLYFPAWLVTAGVGVVTAYKLNVMLVTVMTLLIAFFCAKAAFGDDRCAFTAAVTYGFSGYFAIDTYTRAAVGEMTAFAFVPLVFLGLWSILCGDKKKWLCLPVGLTFLLVSHVLSAFAAVLLCAVFFLCYLGRVIKEPRRLLYIGYAVLVFAVLSASFLFPMLEQMASGTFLSTDGTSATYYGTLTQRSLPWWASVFDFNTRLDYKSAAFGFWIPNGLGMSFFVMLAAFVRYITRIDDKKNLFVFLYFSVFLLLMTTELFPWSYFQSLCGTMQFPWRLLLFATFFMALFAGQFIRQGADEKRVGGFLHPVRLLLAVFVRFDRERLDSQLRQLRREWHRDHLQLQGQHRRGRISALLRFESAVLPLVSVQPSGQGDDEQRFSRHAEGRARAWQRLGRFFGKQRG